MLAVVNSVKLGVIDKTWTTAVVIDVVAIASIPVLLRYLDHRDDAALRRAPAGTLFASGFSLSIQELGEPCFSASRAAVGRGRWRTGWISGSILISADGLRLDGKPALADDVGHIDFGDLSTISLTKLPAKIDIGGLDLTFHTGESLSLEVRRYHLLRSCLQQLQTVA